MVEVDEVELYETIGPIVMLDDDEVLEALYNVVIIALSDEHITLLYELDDEEKNKTNEVIDEIVVLIVWWLVDDEVDDELEIALELEL